MLFLPRTQYSGPVGFLVAQAVRMSVVLGAPSSPKPPRVVCHGVPRGLRIDTGDPLHRLRVEAPGRRGMSVLAPK